MNINSAHKVVMELSEEEGSAVLRCDVVADATAELVAEVQLLQERLALVKPRVGRAYSRLKRAFPRGRPTEIGSGSAAGSGGTVHASGPPAAGDEENDAGGSASIVEIDTISFERGTATCDIEGTYVR